MCGAHMRSLPRLMGYDSVWRAYEGSGLSGGNAQIPGKRKRNKLKLLVFYASLL